MIQCEAHLLERASGRMGTAPAAVAALGRARGRRAGRGVDGAGDGHRSGGGHRRVRM